MNSSGMRRSSILRAFSSALPRSSLSHRANPRPHLFLWSCVCRNLLCRLLCAGFSASCEAASMTSLPGFCAQDARSAIPSQLFGCRRALAVSRHCVFRMPTKPPRQDAGIGYIIRGGGLKKKPEVGIKAGIMQPGDHYLFQKQIVTVCNAATAPRRIFVGCPSLYPTACHCNSARSALHEFSIPGDNAVHDLFA